MKAVRIHRFGPPQVMALEELEAPSPDANQVLVRVRAAGVGPWDAWVRAGKSALPQPLPLTLGADISGTVVGLGSGVSTLQPGDEVFGVTNRSFTGAYAQYAVAHAGMLAAKPTKLTHHEAAGVGVVAVTAQQMLFDHAGLRPGQRVLIHGAAGSVGAAAVQLALRAEAHVVAHERHRGVEYAASLGAQEVVDADRQRLDDVVAPVDVVIDTVGGELQTRSIAPLKPGGILVSSVSAPDPELLARHGVRGQFMLVDVNSEALHKIAQAIDRGELTVRIGALFALAQARDAHEALEGMRPRSPGKMVLSVDPT